MIAFSIIWCLVKRRLCRMLSCWVGGWGVNWMWQGKVYLGLSYLSISVLKRVPLDYRIWVFGVLTPTSATDECCCLREHLMWGTSLCSCSGSKKFPSICLSTKLVLSAFGLILFFFPFGLGWGVTWKMHADEDTHELYGAPGFGSMRTAQSYVKT